MTQDEASRLPSASIASAALEPPSGVFVLGELWLWPGFAVTRPALSQLLVTDIHLGKAARFRALGVPVPEQVTEESLDRLSDLIVRTQAKSLVVLGDLIHDPSTLNALIPPWTRWRNTHPELELKLIVGNHDRKGGLPLKTQALPGLLLYDEPHCDHSLFLAHDAEALRGLSELDSPQILGLCGHEHPVISIPDRSVSARIRRPCFYLDHQQILHLPAFGSFTGGHPVALADCKRLFVDMVGAVCELSPSLIQARRRRF